MMNSLRGFKSLTANATPISRQLEPLSAVLRHFFFFILQFVSHPFSQLILNTEVYRNVPFLEKSALKQAVLILLTTVLYPLVFIVWLAFESCFPRHEVSRMFHSPCAKFLIFCGSHQTFLVLLAVTSFHSAFLGYTIVGKRKRGE